MQKYLCCSINPFTVQQSIALCDPVTNTSTIIATLDLGSIPATLSHASYNYGISKVYLFGPSELLQDITEQTYDFHKHTFNTNLTIEINP